MGGLLPKLETGVVVGDRTGAVLAGLLTRTDNPISYLPRAGTWPLSNPRTAHVPWSFRPRQNNIEPEPTRRTSLSTNTDALQDATEGSHTLYHKSHGNGADNPFKPCRVV